MRDVHHITQKTKATQGRQTDTTLGQRRMHARQVLQGPPVVTHTFKAEADTRKKREPPTHTHHNKQTTQPGNASKEKRNKNNTPQRHENKKDRQARRSTSRTQDHGWTGKPTTVPLTPGSKTRVLQRTTTKERKQNKQTNKQTNNTCQQHT